MVKCEKCGQEFISEKQLEFINKKLGIDTPAALCEKCKKIAVAENFKNIYENTAIKKSSNK